jgi:hypothetical protein
MINWHLAYWPPQLNVKVLPSEAKVAVRNSFEELFSWLDDNWYLSTGLDATAVDKNHFMTAGYGIKRLRSLLNFMDSEDWSQRLPETIEWINLLDKQRGNSFSKTFPELAELLNIRD